MPPSSSSKMSATTTTSTTTTFRDILFSLLTLLSSFLASISDVFKNGYRPSDYYRPRLYYPTAPAYFRALKTRDAPGAEDGQASATDNKVDSDNESKTETVSIRSFIEKKCPALLKDYIPTWWLPGGHAATIYCVLGDFTQHNLVDYERVILRLPDGGTIGLDCTPPTSARTLDPKTPIIVALHGLSGGSFESYIRDVLAKATAPKEDGGLGYRGVVMNFRGCANVPLTTAQLYSGAHTDDLRSTLLYLRETYPEAPLLGIGFSLGANVLTRYVEQEGENCRLRSACVLGCPWDLPLNSHRLESRFMYRNLYSKAMGGNLLFLLRSHLATLAKIAPTNATPHIEKLLKMRAPTLKDFDHHVTRWIGGNRDGGFPYESADDYYAGSSGHKELYRVKIPFLALNSADDPIVAECPLEDVAREDNQWVVQVVTPFGGHLGWWEGGNWNVGGWMKWGGPPPRWIRKPVLEWLKATAEGLGPERDLDLVKMRSASATGNVKKGRTWLDGKGFIRETGKRDVGYRVLGIAGKVAKPTGLEGHLAAAGS